MVFSSPIFLFGFLPSALIIYYAAPRAIKNLVLLITSLLFYAWGEVFYIGVMLLSIASNYFIGKRIFSVQHEPDRRTSPLFYLSLGIVINICLLVCFKYANFITNNVNEVLSIFSIARIDLEPIHLPLGISFFTFQAISYIVDVYRKEVEAQDSLINLSLYISLFPQLIAGPIVRYKDVAQQIIVRSHSVELFSSGVRRFVTGLAKKLLIANTLGEVADNIFSLPGSDLTMPLAWIGILAYSLQIYFDFSAYSDMAIGLGRMFGFRFRENFNYPYISKSLREFWRRWHISLSTWFRDYVFIPLGGSRVSTRRVYLNLLLVFLLTGIWHGANWNFVAWGLFHGVFLIGERLGIAKILKAMWAPFQHLYLIVVVLASWVFFRADTFTQAVDYFIAMGSLDNWYTSSFQYAQVLTDEFIYAFLVGLIFALPVYPFVKNSLENYSKNNAVKNVLLIYIPRLLVLSSLFMLSALKVASSTYNPFIYYRF